jgi:replication-associated recombination protein RarA
MFAIIEIASVLELIAMSHLSEQILQTVEALSAEDQRQVLDFVEFLWTKRQKARTTELETVSRSFFEVAQASIGAGEGPGDLSTNPDYMQGYGQ